MISKLKATVLSDNSAADGMRGEWGLSIYLEDGERKILLDAGASGLFAENAEKLGKSIEDVDIAVLSHAHSDHAGGMRRFFALNQKSSFYLRKGTAENCYVKKYFFRKYIGLPRRILRQFPERIQFAEGDIALCPDVYLIPHHTPGLEAAGRREQMFRKNGWNWQPDDFRHEQSLVFDTSVGLVIFNSCSHGGAANIIREVAERFPGKQVYGLIGGFHLFNKTEEEVRHLASEIRDTGIQYICTGHCTKERALGILEEELGSCVHRLKVGMVMEFGPEIG